MTTQGCQHYGLILANKTGEFIDPLIKMYICLSCGTPQLVYPVEHFENNKVAKAQLLKMAKDIKLPSLSKRQESELLKKYSTS